MKELKVFKKSVGLITCVIIAFVIFLSASLCSPAVFSAVAETPSGYIKVSVPNGQFETSNSLVVDSLPQNWTGEYVGSFTQGDVKAGIISLDITSDNSSNLLDESGLSNYNEYKYSTPTTPFGKNLTDKNAQHYFPETNQNVLMVNTNGTETAYGFTSDEINLEANSFYRFSIWAKTGKFADNRGAVIKLSGLPYDIGFWNVDNSTEIDNDEFGFSEYLIYVATPQNSSAAKICLQVGDYYKYEDNGTGFEISYSTPSKGYAFFDNITCEQLSADTYYSRLDNNDEDNKVIADFITSATATGSQYLKNDQLEIGSFVNGTDGWERISHDNGGGRVNVYDAALPFNDNNTYGLSEMPYAPNGYTSYSDYDKNILVLNTNNSNVGLRSGDITIERNKFYVISAWAKTYDSASASMVITGENNIPSDNYELSPVELADISGSGNINSRYGWSKYFFYIKGSVNKTLKINLELWLGYTDDTTGTAVFDEIRIEEIPYYYYDLNSTGGSTVGFDSIPSTTIENGRFTESTNFTAEYPLVPTTWTSFNNTENVDVVSGIVLTDEEHFTQNQSLYNYAANPISQADDATYNVRAYPSLLLLSSTTEANFGYTSPSISIASGNFYKITVNMKTSQMTGSGANLALYSGNERISSVNNIYDTVDFKTYSFYIKGDVAFESGTGSEHSLELRISMGSENKRASGNIYVLEATCESLNEDEYNSRRSEFISARNNPLTLDYAVYSFSDLDFFYYDTDSTDALRQTTAWSVDSHGESGTYAYGVFDPRYKTGNDYNSYIPDYVSKAHDACENKFDTIFGISVNDSHLTAMLTNPIRFEPNSYYMVSVSVLVALGDANNYGAEIGLSGDYSSVSFKDIKTTSEVSPIGYKFVIYEFYISTGAEETTSNILISLGGSSNLNQYTSGKVFVNYINVQKLVASQDTLEETDTLLIIDNHIADEEIDDTETTPESDQVEDNEKWWLIPSILFGVAILVAIAGVIIKNAIVKAQRRQRKKAANSYDRRFTLNFDAQENDQEQFNDEIIDTVPQNSEFDDDKPSAQVVVETNDDEAVSESDSTIVNSPNDPQEGFKDEFDD